jgi:type II restriction enzyme
MAFDLTCSAAPSVNYRSKAQIARVVTENWCATSMYCPACSSNALASTANNCPGIDFNCPKCGLSYQLKSSKTAFKNRVVDAGYDAMINAVRSAQVPNLLLLHYSAGWSIIDLFLIPSFFFTESSIEKRKPLSVKARRAGWIGCNILLDKIPVDGRIAIVSSGVITSPSEVRREYQRIKPLKDLNVDTRGWTLVVLNLVRKLDTQVVLLSDIYAFEPYLQSIHPQNKNIRAKIRQQLQILRDMGLLAFEGNGRYRVLQ